jgi:hypothetical protein
LLNKNCHFPSFSKEFGEYGEKGPCPNDLLFAVLVGGSERT